LNSWTFSIAGSLLVCLVSLTGSFALFVKPQLLERNVNFLVSLSVGVLLGDAFLHLIPDSLARIGSIQIVMLWTLGGILLFFMLEKVVRWQHRHEVYPSQEKSLKPIRPLARMNLIGDAVHNFIDGTLIAGSFLVSPVAGITTTLAIVIHEIPQEIGDVGALVYGGYAPRKAVWYNFLCSLTCLAGAVCMLIAGSWLQEGTLYLLPLAAGGFIYIASSDLIPELHKKGAMSHHLAQGLLISLGIGAMILVTYLENRL
jgi:zinc and cadmium transporter